MSTSVPPLKLDNGIELPASGLGVLNTESDKTITVVQAAIDAGYRLIDTAAAYFNEREVGEAIRRSGIDRAEMFITTKLWTAITDTIRR